MIMIILVLLAFVFITNRLIVRRIKNLNKDVLEVAKGNFSLTTPIKGNDEISELGENFNKMAAELQANAFLSKNFARYVSHEFKTPLAVIRSYAEAISMNNQDKETIEYSEIIMSETDRLNEMTKAIMELCRLDSTTMLEKKDSFSPKEQIKEILLSAKIKCDEKKINVKEELEEFDILGNEPLTFRIWQNLINNAIKFTDENGNIRISLIKNNEEMIFTINDDGIGITEEDKDKIFDMFFMGDKSRNKQGNGLGLTLVKTIVEKLGGEISFYSQRNKGSEFKVKIPL